METNNIEYKQNYLRTEIIEQQYDPEEFSKFLSEEKEDIGLDLNNWTFEELKNVVSKFKTMKENLKMNDFNQKDENENEIINSEMIKTNITERKEFINCIKQNKNDFSDIQYFKIIISK
jgi:hypothetical protein